MQLNLLFLALLIMISYLMLTIGDEARSLGTDLMMETRPVSIGQVRRSESVAGIFMLTLLWIPILGLAWLEIQHLGLGYLREKKTELNWEKTDGSWILKSSKLDESEALEFIPTLYEINGMSSDKSFLEVSLLRGIKQEKRILKFNRFNSLKHDGEKIVLPERVMDKNQRSFLLVPTQTVVWNERAPLFPSLTAYGLQKFFLGAILLLILSWVSRRLSVEMGLFVGVGFWIYYKITTVLGSEFYEESLDRLERLGPLDESFTNLWWEPIAYQFTQFSSVALELLQALEIASMDSLLEEGMVASMDFGLAKLGLFLFVLLMPPLICRIFSKP